MTYIQVLDAEIKVLIETLWNVKMIGVRLAGLTQIVLIETLWNVKDILKFYNDKDVVRINRNIVECKADKFLSLCSQSGINRNIVECKVQTGCKRMCDFTVLIETLWNVKGFDPAFVSTP